MTAAETPDGRFTLGTWLFLRVLAIVHLIAFASFWSQLEGLIGPNGVLPATRYFEAVHAQLGPAAYAQLPSLCWWFGTGAFLHVLCAVGIVGAVLLFAGIAPVACLALLWTAYLSLNGTGQIFFNFQWDTLLLETTVMAAFVAPWSLRPRWQLHPPPIVGRLLLAWLLFRLMFFSGVVKLTSGDPTWRDFTALTFHFETQPLPTPLAWFVHQLPVSAHRASCVAMFTMELLLPFFVFAPRRFRHPAVLLIIALMLGVALTGNYTFFNLLAIALCLPVLDDGFWRRVLPARLIARLPAVEDVRRPARWIRATAGTTAALIFGYTLLQAVGLPPGFRAVESAVAPFRSLNTYGLFAVMTHPRPELIFEGSDDGREWRAYELPHKPGATGRRPTWVAPHQPRLDWQLWFAALSSPAQNPWVLGVCEHLLRGTPEVLTLFAHNPFPDKPPRAIRVVRYEYHFTDAATRAATGQWWRRTSMDFYVPSASLR